MTSNIRRKPHINLEIAIPDCPARDRIADRIAWIVGDHWGMDYRVYATDDGNGSNPLVLILDYRGPTTRGLSKGRLAELKAFIRGALMMWDMCNKHGVQDLRQSGPESAPGP